MEQRSGLISTPSLSLTQTETGGQSGDNRGTLHLRLNGSQRKGSKKKSKAKVSWSDDVVDNEHMNKKKSKVCCIFHPHKEFGELSSDSDSDSSNGLSASEDEEDRQGRRNNYIHNRNHNHSHDHNHDHDHDNDHDSHDHEHSSDRHIHRMRSPSPNAYERQPHFKPNVRPSAIENTN